MKRVLAYIFLAFIAFVFEARLSVFGAAPDASAMLVYYLGMRHGPAKGALAGALVGAMADSLSGGLLGPHLLGKSFVGFFAPVISTAFFGWTPALGMALAGSLTLIDRAVSFSAISIALSAPSAGAQYWVVWQCAINSAVGLFIRPSERAEMREA